MNNTTISVTIATYNRPHLLKKCLNALAKQTLDAGLFEIIICDSHSKEETGNTIIKFCEKNPTLKVSHLHTKNILAAKRNLGIKAAKGNIVLL